MHRLIAGFALAGAVALASGFGGPKATRSIGSVRLEAKKIGTAPGRHRVRSGTTTVPPVSTTAPVATSTTSTTVPPTTAPPPPPRPTYVPQTTAPRPPQYSQYSYLGGVWAALRMCESGGNYAENTGNGYYGAYQFSLGTWRALGYTGLPSDAPPAVQDEAARRLQAMEGWGPWGGCARRLGLI
jgi:hypothetical protein